MSQSPSLTGVEQPVWRRAMGGRGSGERHRAATPLELLFDLCFVVAVAQTGCSP